MVFLANGTQVLFIGLHPELAPPQLAVQNRYFERGVEEWGFRWVNALYPNNTLDRVYTVEFTEENFVVRVNNATLMRVPYSELTDSKERFLGRIDAVKFQLRGSKEVVMMDYEKLCPKTGKLH